MLSVSVSPVLLSYPMRMVFFFFLENYFVDILQLCQHLPLTVYCDTATNVIVLVL